MSMTQEQRDAIAPLMERAEEDAAEAFAAGALALFVAIGEGARPLTDVEAIKAAVGIALDELSRGKLRIVQGGR